MNERAPSERRRSLYSLKGVLIGQAGKSLTTRPSQGSNKTLEGAPTPGNPPIIKGRTLPNQ
jgi:hypothetical protein